MKKTPSQVVHLFPLSVGRYEWIRSIGCGGSGMPSDRWTHLRRGTGVSVEIPSLAVCSGCESGPGHSAAHGSVWRIDVALLTSSVPQFGQGQSLPHLLAGVGGLASAKCHRQEADCGNVRSSANQTAWTRVTRKTPKCLIVTGLDTFQCDQSIALKVFCNFAFGSDRIGRTGRPRSAVNEARESAWFLTLRPNASTYTAKKGFHFDRLKTKINITIQFSSTRRI